MSIANKKEIRVFLSSTFRDMMYERDYLLKNTFNEVRLFARGRGVNFTVIDLRWGVTEREAQQGKVVRICLEEINKCKPYFIGFLGERYGWVPNKSELDHYGELVELFPVIEAGIKESKSITEMEMLYGALANDKDVNAIFFERSLSLTEKFSKGKPKKVYFDQSPVLVQKLRNLKKQVRESRFKNESYSDLKALGRSIYDYFIEEIDRSFPASSQLSSLEQLIFNQINYVSQLSRHYVPNHSVLMELDRFVDQGSDQSIMVIKGESGSGKSSLLAYWSQTIAARSNYDLIQFYPGADKENDAVDLLKYLVLVMRRLNHSFGFDETESEKKLKETQESEESSSESDDNERSAEDLPSNLNKLISVFNDELQKQPENKPLIIIVDAINQIEDTHLRWIPLKLPKSVKLILSTLPSLNWRRLEKKDCETLTLSEITENELVTITERYLGHYRKKLSLAQIEKLKGCARCHNPLFLVTVLNELQQFGNYELLDELIDHLISSQTIIELFDKIIHRKENDYGKVVTRNVLKMLWGAKNGASEDEIIACTRHTQLVTVRAKPSSQDNRTYLASYS